MKKKNPWRVKGGDTDAYQFIQAKSEKRRNKEYCSMNGKLMVRTRETDTHNHRMMLRSLGCYSDIFTACTPEDLHEIADNELDAVTSHPLTKFTLELFRSWTRYMDEMRCMSVNESQWIMYRNRDACDDLVRTGCVNVGLYEKIEDTHKKMLYLCFRVPGSIDMWSVDSLLDAWKNSTLNMRTCRSLRIRDFLSKTNMDKVFKLWSSWISSEIKPQEETKFSFMSRFYENNTKSLTLIGVRNKRHLKKAIVEYEKTVKDWERFFWTPTVGKQA